MRFKPYTLTIIAATGYRFVDFAPYVASISDNGVVAFQATLQDGHSGVFTGDGQSIRDIAVTTSVACPVQRFSSHPDINQAGAIAVYGTLKNGEDALLLYADGNMTAIGALEQFVGIGPLGPTMNEQNDIAFRGSRHIDRASIHLRHGTESVEIAAEGAIFRGFEGLPVVNNHGLVAFRTDMRDGRQGIFTRRGGQCTAIAMTGDDFAEIARFPSVNDQGTVAFVATHKLSGPGIFAVTTDRTTCLVDATVGFESFRGVLINNTGPVVFYATPSAGQLGIYAGPAPLRHRIFGLGDTLFDAEVIDFALNPVSVNELGQLAIRAALSDGRQFILRADPEG